jgi:hypothetical protein
MNNFGMKAVFLFFSLSTLTHAAVGDEVLRFKKCYSLFVREVLPADSTLLASVKAGTMSGTDACMNLFDKGVLGTNNQIAKNADGTYDQTAMKILKTFNGLHQSFFEIPDYIGSLMTFSEFATPDMIDPSEGAYHLTYTLLKKDEPYSKVITRNSSLKALRYSTKSQRTRRVYDGGFLNFFIGNAGDGDPAHLVPFSPSLMLETGALVGFTTPPSNPTPALPGFNAAYSGSDFWQHFGAGVIGTQGFLMSSTAFIFGEQQRFTDGGVRTNRRWSKRVFSDLLCRPVPVLRNSDVIADVNMNSNLPFRKGISCMGCHSSMDPMAGVIRNLTSISTTATDVAYAVGIRFFVHRSPDMPPMDFPVLSGDDNFYRSPASGRLKYRSYDGKLISEEVSDLEDLGMAIAEQDDLYACAAKRYFNFLTGITADLSDSGDMNSPKLGLGETLAREKVIELGLQLKQHQSLRTLLKTIISSETFIHPSQGV